MKKRVVIFEAEGGNDKWIDGHRKDTMPIANSLKNLGFDCEVLFFRPEWKDTIFSYVKGNFDAYISWVNPGSIKGEKIYLDTLRRLSEEGVLGMPHPDVMVSFGAKNALTSLVGTGLVPEDTYCYYDVSEFKEKFPLSLSLGERVLK